MHTHRREAFAPVFMLINITLFQAIINYHLLLTKFHLSSEQFKDTPFIIQQCVNQ